MSDQWLAILGEHTLLKSSTLYEHLHDRCRDRVHRGRVTQKGVRYIIINHFERLQSAKIRKSLELSSTNHRPCHMLQHIWQTHFYHNTQERFDMIHYQQICAATLVEDLYHCSCVGHPLTVSSLFALVKSGLCTGLPECVTAKIAQACQNSVEPTRPF